MTQHVVKVNGVDTLFSPVLAHSLEPGDLFTLGPALQFRVVPWRRVLAVTGRDAVHLGIIRSHPQFAGGIAMTLKLNATVYRAVGARAQGGGAR